MNKVDTSDWERYVAEWVEQAGAEALRYVEAAAQNIRTSAIRRSPVNTGYLRAGWQVGSQRFGDKATVTIYNPVPYVKAIEYGTRPRSIFPRNPNGVLRWYVNGQPVFAKYVMKHPGSRPRPMLRPALDEELPKLKRKLEGL